MDYSTLFSKTVPQLKLLAKQSGKKLPSEASKSKIIEILMDESAPAQTAQELPAVSEEKTAEPTQRADESAPQSEDTRKRPRRASGPKTKKAEPAAEAEERAAVSVNEAETKADSVPAEAPDAETEAAELNEIIETVQENHDLRVMTGAETETEAPVPEVPAEELPAEKPAETAKEKELVFPHEVGDGAGVLEIHEEGYGFLRAENCLQGPKDVYVSSMLIKRFALRSGDYIEGKTRPVREGDRSEGMIYVTGVNGRSATESRRRPHFEDLTPVYPDFRLRLEAKEGRTDSALRMIDLLSPIGKGQRGLIVSPPKAGKTELLKRIANAITANYPEVQLMVLLIDERPEEVTDMQRSTNAEVLYSTFDQEPEHHVKLSEMVLAKAQRQVEMGRDVVILLDSITRLARAYNLTIAPTGRLLTGGIDPGALRAPKRFFGAARNIENGGSLTVIATALVDTGSRMDDVIYEEFKGTGNMELHLDRKLSERRVFPAIDLTRSGTRRDDLLFTREEAEAAAAIRRRISAVNTDPTELVLSYMAKTADNAQLVRCVLNRAEPRR